MRSYSGLGALRDFSRFRVSFGDGRTVSRTRCGWRSGSALRRSNQGVTARQKPGRNAPMANLRGAVIPVTPFQQNCAILWDDATKHAMVVDPGGDVDRILAAIDQAGVTVERILLTHGHLDHAGGAAELAAACASAPATPPPSRSKAPTSATSSCSRASKPRPRLRLRRPQRHAGPLAARGRLVDPGRAPLRRPALPGPHARATSSSSTTPPASRWSATCCSRARSAAPTFPMATMPR